MIMTKKILGTITFLCILFAFVACNSSNASQRNINIAENAISIVDRFLDGDISPRQAIDELDRLQSISIESTGNLNEDLANLSVSGSKLLLSIRLSSAAWDNNLENQNSVLEARNALAEDAGLRTRR